MRALTLSLVLLSGCYASYARTIAVPVSSAEVPDLSGTWNSQWGEDYIAVIFMKQEGDRVTATYTTTARLETGAATIEGSLEGRLVGNVLRGTWEEGGNRFGRFRFVFRADGRSYEGTWEEHADALEIVGWPAVPAIEAWILAIGRHVSAPKGSRCPSSSSSPSSTPWTANKRWSS